MTYRIQDIASLNDEELKEFKPLTQTLLKNRGINTKEEAQDFLNPVFGQKKHDPFGLLNMEKAIDRIFQAIENEENILVYADYDCDGIPGAVIFHDFLTEVGHKNFSIFIPDRQAEGYGLHMHALDSTDKKIDLVITIDVGITSVEAVDEMNSKGIDVIITDHHLPKETLPNAYTIVNPKQEKCKYEDDMLCGAGVAFKIIQALIIKYNNTFDLHKGWEKWLLDMVGMATLSDMVPLVGENRIFAYYGLKVLQRTRRQGLLHIYRDAKLLQNRLTEDDIAFMVVPKINAAGRLDHPIKAFDALLGGNKAEVLTSASELVSINKKRKTLVATIVKQTKSRLSKREIKNIVVIGDPDFNTGVTGLVASKIAEEHKKPAFVWGQDTKGVIRGSFRSFGGVHFLRLAELLPVDTFISFGGHKEAGGFSISKDKIHFLEDNLNEAFQKLDSAVIDEEDYVVDSELSLLDFNNENFFQIKKLSPFGVGNPKPMFAFKNLEISSIRLFGKTKEHLEVFFGGDGREVKAIEFFATPEKYDNVKEGDKVDLLATFEESFFMGRRELRLRISHIYKL
jgi:single-stranded-DNA-specific exonuclease